ncbi:hypothetical protein AAH983_13640, partial [Enterococcus faecium]
MAPKKAPMDFDALLDEVNADFPVYQALDQDGNVVNKDVVPDLSDDELVELMTHMAVSYTHMTKPTFPA